MGAEADNSNIDWFQDVRDFHSKFGLPIGTSPATMHHKELRRKLHKEEAQELDDAMEADDLVEIADAIADSIYVMLGTAVSYGIDIRPIWKAVHDSNMAKEGGGSRSDGKILKPAGWKKPPVKELLEEQASK